MPSGDARNGAASGGETMNDAFELRSGDTHIEVHKFFPGAIAGVTIAALALQAAFPVYVRRLDFLDLPLLITIYFGLSRRNPSTGLLLGTTIGLLQDSLSGPTVPLGLYGIAKTVVGYLASSIGARLDTEHPAGALRADGRVFCAAPGRDRADAAVAAGAAGAVVQHAPGHCRGGECGARRTAIFAVGSPAAVVIVCTKQINCNR